MNHYPKQAMSPAGTAEKKKRLNQVEAVLHVVGILLCTNTENQVLAFMATIFYKGRSIFQQDMVPCRIA